jgi:hypothetical protein
MTTDTKTFVHRHEKHLPIKYLRKSVTALFNKNIDARDVDSLDQIQEEFTRFIKTPVH